MARIGLKRFRYAELDNDTEKYGEVKSLGKAIDCKVSLELNNAELYADDTLAESDYSLKKGTISLTTDEDDDTVFSEILGHQISTVPETAGEIVRKDTDVAPYFGVGRILTKVVNSVYKYKVEFLSKVKFKDAMPDEKTKGENIEYTTTSIEGSVLKLKDGTWSKSKTFTDYAQAEAYLDSLFVHNEG